ncbi:Pyruvate/2-oxoglutarate dehydrogenase complex, dihydrolipoamide dehydrogenase (E3) component [Nitrosomonas marina]|uniref:Pyruvate/2-oxoglutarate dehydrogenase complex, dihydrolipoamide dehydrogenase (E3) component n=1 Tax=Nitrosomonas marina TaxID=917 RepID=A0A1I0CLX7_9PROT|nr:bifunctional TVP38/TMEM64 family protein/FAD-dependent oxidoreductase [Nitrosomonas marina]SET20636.1 Pyruvate/2-oxoglutarate dehydrogenase complex, dihydrolipoamide dehydrogenase (E3) component [Nitrosomonas marina]
MNKRWWLLCLLGLLIILFFGFDLQRYFSLDMLKSSNDMLQQVYKDEPFLVIGIYSLTYIIMAALSLPGAAVMTLAGGAMFGLWIAVPVVLVSATVGATLAFWASRYILRDTVQRRFGDRLETINNGLERDGVFYLFSLRLVPAFPFFLINLLMGLTRIRSGIFFWVTLIGMFPGSAVYVNAGTQLASIDNLSDILSPGLILSFLLLAVFPWLARWGVGIAKKRRLYARWSKPETFDRNLVVIGAGAAGLVTAYIAAAVRAKVTLIESHKMGGDCLNYGCVPSKTLIRSAGFLKEARQSVSLGVKQIQVNYDFADVMARVQRVIKAVEPHDSIERYTRLGVEVVEGHARITSPWSVEVNGQTLTTRAIVIASGASPVVPDIPGLESMRYFTSDTIWSLTERPERLIVLGGGPIGCELAQAFARLDSQVIQIEQDDLLQREDSDARTLVKNALQEDGVQLLTHTKAVRCEIAHEPDGKVQRLIVQDQHGREQAIAFDAILCAVGRRPRTEGFGLEELGISVTSRRTIDTNAWLQTIYPNIYTCGDVAGPYQFTHTAAHQAWYASVNALFGDFKRFKADYSVIPWTTFTDPEIARAGLSEDEANARGVAVEVTRYGLDDLDRAITDEATDGFIKVLTVPGKDRILGVTIAGKHASDLLAEYVLAMKHGLGLNKILGTIHTYPTWPEANKYAAGKWKRAHAPEKLLQWVERFHAWRRGEKASQADRQQLRD